MYPIFLNLVKFYRTVSFTLAGPGNASEALRYWFISAPALIMKKIGNGYMPCVTPLTHEQGFTNSRAQPEQMTPVENGGWDVESLSFTPVQNYRCLNQVDYDDKKMLFIPLWRLFLDAFTAAVENGYINHTNWKLAFRFREDWMALGIDLRQADTDWLNERHYNAVIHTILHDDQSTLFTTYPELGNYLMEKGRWRPAPPGIRLV